MKDKKLAVLANFYSFAKFYKEKNLEKILGLLEPNNDNILCYGTGIDERRIGKEQAILQIKRDFEQAKQMLVNYHEDSWHISAYQENLYAMVAVNLDILVKTLDDKEVNFPNMRCSALQICHDGKWLFNHLHWSCPMSEQPAGYSIPEHLLAAS